MTFDLDLDRLAATALEGASNRDSGYHGPEHWQRVAEIGLGLCLRDQAADPTVVALFALLHDTQRLNEDEDPLHGPRAASYALELFDAGKLAISDQQLHALMDACQRHTTAGPTADPTAGACFDSDRLTLWRVGTRPQPRYLSTQATLNDERWLLVGLQLEMTRPMSWQQLTDAYRTGCLPEGRPVANLIAVAA